MNKYFLIIMTALTLSFSAGCTHEVLVIAEQWTETEIVFFSEKQVQNPYTDIEFWGEFTGLSGEKLIRPGFWDGGNCFKIRFANPLDKGEWQWNSIVSDSSDAGLHGKTGKLASAPYSGNNPLVKNGLLRMSPGKRNVVHANGKPFLMIGDTPWGLPWRGTVESVTEFAQKRQSQGFNTALLMSLQPDMEAKGPTNRILPEAFDVAFEDMKEGHINQPNMAYFQYFDTLRNILADHGIVPVYQPVFHGFGWKGQKVLGWDMDIKEYARYCRYLVARYGARHAMWLVGADRTFQEAAWLDFQWCQTGHGGEHQPWKVEKMGATLPVKAVANGEPTYEGIRDSANGSGWWQGHEAWHDFTSGGTMDMVYGAGGLWNWKLFKDESGWPEWANSNVSWKKAIQLPGANYVGYLGKALEGIDITDIEKHHGLADGKLCLAKPGSLYVVYLPEGGEVTISDMPEKLMLRWFNPVDGVFYAEGTTTENQVFSSEKGKPSVLIVSNP